MHLQARYWVEGLLLVLVFFTYTHIYLFLWTGVLSEIQSGLGFGRLGILHLEIHAKNDDSRCRLDLRFNLNMYLSSGPNATAGIS